MFELPAVEVLESVAVEVLECLAVLAAASIERFLAFGDFRALE